MFWEQLQGGWWKDNYTKLSYFLDSKSLAYDFYIEPIPIDPDVCWLYPHDITKFPP